MVLFKPQFDFIKTTDCTVNEQLDYAVVSNVDIKVLPTCGHALANLHPVMVNLLHTAVHTNQKHSTPTV